MIATPEKATIQAIKFLVVGRSLNHNQAMAMARSGLDAKITETLAIAVCLNEVRNAAVAEAPMIATIHPGLPICRKS